MKFEQIEILVIFYLQKGIDQKIPKNQIFQISLTFPINMLLYILLALLVAGCSKEQGSFSNECSTRSCLTNVQSGNQVYRFSLIGSEGVLEEKSIYGGQWRPSAAKPELEGFAVAFAFSIKQNLLVSHCDESGNSQILKFNPRNESWSRARFETSGCSNH